MILYLYTLIIYGYGMAIRIASWWSPKAKQWIEGRKNIFQIIEKERNQLPDRPWIWIHVSSLGEYEQVKRLLHRLKDETTYAIALSFFSPSGYEYIKDQSPADLTFYMPLDTKANAKQTIASLRPEFAIFVKYDFWWNHLRQLQLSNIPNYLVSGVFRKDQYFIKYRLGRIRSILRNLTHFFVQTEDDRKILQELGIDQASVSGDSRLDSILHDHKELTYESVSRLKTLCENSQKPVVIYGSVHQSDIPCINVINKLDALHIIVPHEVASDHIATWTNTFKNAHLLSRDGWSRYMTIVNEMGILKQLYSQADLVYIGGGFGKGIHNILEPLVYLQPILIGPKYHKFPEAMSLVSTGAIRTIESAGSINHDDLLNLVKMRDVIAQKQMDYIRKHSGATDFIFKSLVEARLSEK